MTGIGELVPLTKDALLGAWRMTSATYEIVGTSEKSDALGAHPRGWIVYSPERVMVLVLKSDRKKPAGLAPTSICGHSHGVLLHRDKAL
jgi:hypothetical protein